jgi:hypothetical protein
VTTQPELVQVVPLQQRRKLSDLSPYFQGVNRGLSRTKVDPVIEGEQQIDGRPYAAAPSVAAEVRHLLGLQRVVHRIIAEGQHLTPMETRELILRQAAICDRLALYTPDAADAEATAVQCAWELQRHDVDHRRLVLGEWQPDAIHWTPLTDDPASGCRLYVRQEYPLWLATFEAGWRSYFGRPVRRAEG